MNEFRSSHKIRCLSLPVESNDELSDRATTVSNWWHSVEQRSIELALKYQYIVHTDISDCHGSMYTHSIVWALPEMLNLVIKLNISRRSNPKITKLACKDNPSEPVYITRILTQETL